MCKSGRIVRIGRGYRLLKIMGLFPFYHPFLGGAETVAKSVCEVLQQQDIRTTVLTTDVLSLEPFMRTSIRHDVINNVPVNRFSEVWGPRGYDMITSILKGSSGRRALGSSLSHVSSLESTVRALFGFPCAPELVFRAMQFAKHYDAIITGQVIWSTASISWLLKRRRGIPFFVIPSFHEKHLLFERESSLSILRSANGVLVYTQWEKDALALRGIDSNKIFVMGPMFKRIATEYIPPRPVLSKEPAFKVLFVGRREFDKGYYHFTNAIAKLHRDGIPVKGVILAHYSRRKIVNDPQTESSVRESCLSTARDAFIDLGTSIPDQEKWSVFKSVDALVLPSRVESFGISILEAFCFKKPVIVSEYGPLPSIANGCGLTFPWGNVWELCDRITRLASNHEECLRLGQAGAMQVERYTEEAGRKVLVETISAFDLFRNAK